MDRSELSKLDKAGRLTEGDGDGLVPAQAATLTIHGRLMLSTSLGIQPDFRAGAAAAMGRSRRPFAASKRKPTDGFRLESGRILPAETG